jgi:hypothetical protein
MACSRRLKRLLDIIFSTNPSVLIQERAPRLEAAREDDMQARRGVCSSPRRWTAGFVGYRGGLQEFLAQVAGGYGIVQSVLPI